MSLPSNNAFRVYSATFDAQKASTSWTNIFDSGYVWNDSKNDRTGAWRPLFASDFASNVSISGVTVNTTALEQIASSGVAYQAATSGQTAILVTEATNRWQKTKTNGYVGVFSAITGNCLINKAQGYTKTTAQPSFLMLFDTGSIPAAGSVPDFTAAVQTTNNWYLDLAEAGVQFNYGLQIVNSTTADVYTPVGASDFTASVVYK